MWENSDGPETLVTVTLTAEGSGTRLRFEQSGFATVAARDEHGWGWNHGFDKLADWLTRPAVAV